MTETTVEILQKPRQYIVDENGERVSIVLDIETYRRIMELLEDVIDSKLIDETLGEPTIPLEQVLREEDERRDI